ncbi:hypothetical protein M422DRAFT_779459 [Sphaerobolus stellatus SS14]|uniref:Uncharacterized protein n=1 Tax=Sphaerobolus stellatus (strain SS14) TaxID=990650 RepID=A0A0C9W0F7_SPHS4|nr:hypothetical protein M422DRAFT_779459 [Sphaerobolus stellatus SS14]
MDVDTTIIQTAVPSDIPSTLNTPIINLFSSPARRVIVPVTSPQRPTSPVRFPRPIVPVALDDPLRSPARRVLNPSSPARPLPLDDPNRTPARRVPAPASPSKVTGTLAPVLPRIKVGISSSSKVTSTSPLKQSASAKSTLVASTSAKPNSAFPVRQTSSQNASENTLSVPSSSKTVSTSIHPPPPSKLRQPSSIASKTARGSAQPYAKGVRPSRLPTASSTIHVASPIPRSKAGTSSGIPGPSKLPLRSSVQASRLPSPVKRLAPTPEPPVPSTSTEPPQASTSTKPPGSNTAGSSSLAGSRKRPRIFSDDDSDEPSAKRPVIVVRPVVKGMFGGNAQSSPRRPSSPSKVDVSPVRPNRSAGPIQFRPVIPGTLRHFATPAGTSMDLPPSSERATSPMDVETVSSTITVTGVTRESTTEELNSSKLEPAAELLRPPSTDPQLRRTSRVRRAPTPDPFLVAPTSLETMTTTKRSKSAPVRSESATKASTSRSSTRSGVPTTKIQESPRRIKILTDDNTRRNMEVVVELEKMIVRKPGPRPPSPTTKVRTVLEKSQEERAKGRGERAERRRRRAEGSDVTASSDNEDAHARSSPTPPQKHIQAPGDDEEYESPEKQAKPSRRDPNKIAKSVKWNHALAERITYDEESSIDLGGSAPLKGALKSCLVRDEIVAFLDAFGNLPDTVGTLPTLEREHVIVKKFLYDDDIEEPPLRTTRKKKS